MVGFVGRVFELEEHGKILRVVMLEVCILTELLELHRGRALEASRICR